VTTPHDPLAEIKRLYFAATPATIQRDLATAVGLLTRMADEDERQRAAVYMDGLSQMRSEWGGPPKSTSPSTSRTRSARRPGR
jgi:hypothetical protein